MQFEWETPSRQITVDALATNDTLLDNNYTYRWLEADTAPGTDLVRLGSIAENSVISHIGCCEKNRGASWNKAKLQNGDTLDFYLEQLAPPAFRTHRLTFFHVWYELVKALKCESAPNIALPIRHFYSLPLQAKTEFSKALGKLSHFELESSLIADENNLAIVALSTCKFSESDALHSLAAAFELGRSLDIVYQGMEIDVGNVG